jgi:hypothetical protein
MKVEEPRPNHHNMKNALNLKMNHGKLPVFTLQDHVDSQGFAQFS